MKLLIETTDQLKLRCEYDAEDQAMFVASLGNVLSHDHELLKLVYAALLYCHEK